MGSDSDFHIQYNTLALYMDHSKVLHEEAESVRDDPGGMLVTARARVVARLEVPDEWACIPPDEAFIGFGAVTRKSAPGPRESQPSDPQNSAIQPCLPEATRHRADGIVPRLWWP